MATLSPLPCSIIDNTFHVYAGECRGGFDFTLLFEEGILTVIPLALMLAVAPLRILYLSKKSIKVNESLLLPFKLVSPSSPTLILSSCGTITYFSGSKGILRRLRRPRTRTYRAMGRTIHYQISCFGSYIFSHSSLLLGPHRPLVSRTSENCSSITHP